MKRYDLYKRSISDRATMAVRKSGNWVKYEDVKHLIEALEEIADWSPQTGEDAKEMYDIANKALAKNDMEAAG